MPEAYDGAGDLDRKMAILDAIVAQLAEHFDCVQVFASSADSEGTMSWDRGMGNFNARTGQVREWLTVQAERARCKTRSDWKASDPDEE